MEQKLSNPRQMKSLLKSVFVNRLSAELTGELGFRKSAVGFTKSLNPGCEAYVGTNMKVWGPDCLEVSVIVGVKSMAVSQAASKLQMLEPGQLARMGMISVQLGYLTPQKGAFHWEVDGEDEVQVVVPDIVKKVKEYGLPLFDRIASLGGSIAYLSDVAPVERPYLTNEEYFLPLALWISELDSECLAAVKGYQEKFGSGNVGVNYSRFAAALTSKFGAAL